mgnify:CR=1 FL=1
MSKKFCQKCGQKIIKGTRNQTLCDVCLMEIFEERKGKKPIDKKNK